MKRLSLTVLLLLLATSCFAGFGMQIIEGPVPVSGGGAFCSGCGTGNLVFCWEITADNVDITQSGGCSEGDTTATAQSQVALVEAPAGKTGYAIFMGGTDAGGYDAYTFDIVLDDIFNDEEGTIIFDIYIPEWVDQFKILSCVPQANEDQFYICLTGGNEIRLVYEGSNAGGITVTTPAADMALDTWYTVAAKWRTGETDPSLSISCNGSTGTSNTDLTAFDTAPDVLRIGSLDGVNGYAYIKNIEVYNAWID